MATQMRSTSASRLRQVLSYMAQYRVVPNPLNYALWYCHVGETHPELNKELDQVVSLHGTCPPEKAEYLYRRHILTEDPSLSTVDDGLIQLTRKLRSSVQSAEGETKNYLVELNSIAEELNQQVQGLDLEGLVNRLIVSTDSTLKANSQLKEQMSDAEGEIAKLKAQAQKYKAESQTDSLTELYNRRYFDEQARILVANEIPFSLILCDIDDFKAINDTYGHPFGDKVLQSMSSMIRKATPEGCSAYRMGGEEFGVLLPEISIDEAASIAEEIRTQLGKLVITNRYTNQSVGKFTASFGVGTRENREPLSDLLSRVDRCQYIAKQSGKDRVKTDRTAA